MLVYGGKFNDSKATVIYIEWKYIFWEHRKVSISTYNNDKYGIF